MAIFEITGDDIRALEPTRFAREQLRERQDLQRLLRDRIDLIAPETMVLSEEYGAFDGSQRRIDLLGLDKECRLVVIELKRTEDGGHMDLQGLRYAAMVSSMTFDQAVAAHRDYLRARGRPTEDAEAALLKFLEADVPPQLSQSVRIVLASADFSKEVTTTVLWLNASGLDITCVKMAPYSYGDGRVLLDIQQVIPLPEAAEYQVAIRQKNAEVDAERSRRMRDYTKFDLTIDGHAHQRLTKKDFVFYVVQAAIQRGFKPDRIAQAIPWWTLRRLFASADGVLTADAFAAAFAAAGGSELRRRFNAEEGDHFHVDGRTYVLSSQWGERSEEAVQGVLAMMGNPTEISYSRSAE